jgi:hypothetical protein
MRDKSPVGAELVWSAMAVSHTCGPHLCLVTGLTSVTSPGSSPPSAGVLGALLGGTAGKNGTAMEGGVPLYFIRDEEVVLALEAVPGLTPFSGAAFAALPGRPAPAKVRRSYRSYDMFRKTAHLGSLMMQFGRTCPVRPSRLPLSQPHLGLSQ